MMHRFFYRNFHTDSMQDWMAAVLASFAVGAFFGSLVCVRVIPDSSLHSICSSVVLGAPSVISQVMCCLLPLIFSGVLAYFCRNPKCLLLPPLLCGFLFAFSVSAFVAAFQSAGWIFAALLLSGRGVCLLFLFWFLLRRIQLGQALLSQDLLAACCFSVLCILVFNWLLAPVIRELGQSVFIPT